MPIERIPIKSQQSWLDLRKQDITASAVGALFGLHPYQTVARLAAEKSGIEGLGPDPESAVIRRGQALEKIIPDEVHRLHPDWLVEKAGEYFRDTEARIGATPDFYVHRPDRQGRGILQAKTVAAFIYRREWTPDTPPFWITLQASTEMMLTDVSWGMIAATVIGDWTFETVLYDVDRVIGAERRIRDAVKAFWSIVDEGGQPQVDYERDGDLIALMFPKEIAGKIVDLRTDNAIRDLLDAHENLETVQSDTKKRLATIKAEIAMKIGDAEAALVDGWKVTYKQQTRKAHTVKASSFRVLRTNRQEGAE